jgi:hypothetical protein
MDLAEQDVVSCHDPNKFGCYGINIWEDESAIWESLTRSGISTESCFPYSATNGDCANKCSEWQSKNVIPAGYEYINVYLSRDSSYGSEQLKKALITKGPIYTVLTGINHVMIISGYYTDQDNWPVWIFKNSWGNDWGEKGYAKIKNLREAVGIWAMDFANIKLPITITSQPGLQINCVDKDKDNYCNWGISKEKPSNCPANCMAEEDCDDSNNKLGPFDTNYNCIFISGNATQDKIAPIIGKIYPLSVKKYVKKTFSAQVSDSSGVGICNLMMKKLDDNLQEEYKSYGLMNFSSVPCYACTASSEIDFLEDGKYSLYAQCSDSMGNAASGKEVTIIVSPATSIINTIEPLKAEVNQSEKFSASLKHDTTINICAFKIDGTPVDYMELSEDPCTNCNASVDYTFTKAGKYSAVVRCVDKNGVSFEGDKSTITVGKCPSCANNNTDLCEKEPKCEKNCGADKQCDEKERNKSWINGNTCYYCGLACQYKTDSTKPLNYSTSYDGNTCYYNCGISCGTEWHLITGDSVCNADKNKQCTKSLCTSKGWDNSKCTSGGSNDSQKILVWNPCMPNSTNTCTSKNSCGYGKKEVMAKCKTGETIKTGQCTAMPKNKVVASYKNGNGWYCKFACDNGTPFCLITDGCAYAQCEKK